MRDRREKKKVRRSDPYKGFRKIIVKEQLWRWMDLGYQGVVFYGPDGEKHEGRLTSVVVCKSKWWDPPVLPADARRYIEETILNIKPKVSVDSRAIPGKLYAYREKSTNQGPGIVIDKHTGGAILGAADSAKRSETIFDHLKTHKPLLLLKAWVGIEGIDKKAVFTKSSYKTLLQLLELIIRELGAAPL